MAFTLDGCKGCWVIVSAFNACCCYNNVHKGAHNQLQLSVNSRLLQKDPPINNQSRHAPRLIPRIVLTTNSGLPAVKIRHPASCTSILPDRRFRLPFPAASGFRTPRNVRLLQDFYSCRHAASVLSCRKPSRRPGPIYVSGFDVVITRLAQNTLFALSSTWSLSIIATVENIC